MRLVDYASAADYVFIGEAKSKGYNLRLISCAVGYLARTIGFETKLDNPCVICAMSFNPIEQFKGSVRGDITLEMDIAYASSVWDCAPWVKPGESYIVFGWTNAGHDIETGGCTPPIPLRWQVLQGLTHVGDHETWEQWIGDELDALRSQFPKGPQ